MAQISLADGEGCRSCEMDRGAHEFSVWTCPTCGQEMCWSCSVNCVNDGTGEGPVKCPHCGADGGYFGREKYGWMPELVGGEWIKEDKE